MKRSDRICAAVGFGLLAATVLPAIAVFQNRYFTVSLGTYTTTQRNPALNGIADKEVARLNRNYDLMRPGDEASIALVSTADLLEMKRLRDLQSKMGPPWSNQKGLPLEIEENRANLFPIYWPSLGVLSVVAMIGAGLVARGLLSSAERGERV